MSESHVDTEEVQKVLERMAQGASLRQACTNGLSPWGLLRRVEADPALQQQYLRARELQAEWHGDELLEAIRTFERFAQDPTVTNSQVQALRNAAEQRRWLMARHRPKVYGDRLEVEEKRDVSITITIGAEAKTPDASPVIDVTPIPSLSMPQEVEGDPKPAPGGKRKRGPRGG